jgi:hypothetical protein
MRLLSGVSFVVAALALLAHTAPLDATELGVTALLAAAAAILLGRRRPGWATGALALLSALSALSAAAGESALLPAIAVIAALHGWDMALASKRLAGLPRDEVRPIVLRYVLSSAVLAAGSLSLVALTTIVRIRLSFGVVAALAVAFLLVATIVGVLSRHPRRAATDPSEEAGSALSEPK